jgi:hypothetical protein
MLNGGHMNQQANSTKSSADSIVIQGIAYEVVKRDAKGDGIEALFLRRPNGRRFYLTYARNGVASRVPQ